MPTTVRDASLVAIRNRGIALNNYYNDWKTNTVNSTAPKSALSGPGLTGAETLLQIRDGCNQCTILANIASRTDPNLLPLNNHSRGGAPASTTTS